ncbi:hypothetical protein K2F40_11850 [Clostridium sp. CM028]|uniref:hypothetical protein n=1 Tax=Clostridium TaxID=1485 RepID=UPI0013EE90AA|nr:MULTISPECIES: hypothetical protein [Clostridium]MBU3093437.1 hypothetical protein [Clostridium sp. CF011]MBW9146183.1 hypothetical protein [Clostridium sp. CM027]MBW9149655.1 hypothetical protein [Clostridium sp. CM028]MBZ9606337.1 hypothetical protein [Clostridium estertheticum]UVE39836.1 hypothetical protein KTC92_11400 [Clostridium sp. CM027]
MMNAENKQIESNNLKVIKDQLGYESLLNKKFNEYGSQCTDQNLKNLCTEASQTHKQNFNTLKTYLDSHQ